MRGSLFLCSLLEPCVFGRVVCVGVVFTLTGLFVESALAHEGQETEQGTEHNVIEEITVWGARGKTDR